MNSDPWHLLTADQASLYPPFKAKVDQLLANLRAQGHVFFVTTGLRTVAESEQLYKQGRTLPGRIVSNARGGQSAHNYRIAVDLTHDTDDNAATGLQPDWSEPQYVALAQEAVKLGLESGFNWKFKDAPHVQLPLDSKGIALFKDGTGRPDLLTALQAGGHEAVFALLDGFGW